MKAKITKLSKIGLNEAIDLVFDAGLDTKEEIRHHLEHIDAHFVAMDKGKIVGVVGWYQDNVNYATEAMGDKFPGPEAYWVGFFAVNESYKGKGVGYTLLQHLETVLKKRGVHKLWVSSVLETVRYYKRQNFKLVCTGNINTNQKNFLVKTLK